MGRRGRKRPYPHDSDVAEAVMEVLAKKPYLHPDELVDEVRDRLEEKGFYAGLVTAKRVWRAYEKLVRSGRMYDVLLVVSDETYDLAPEDLADNE